MNSFFSTAVCPLYFALVSFALVTQVTAQELTFSSVAKLGLASDKNGIVKSRFEIEPMFGYEISENANFVSSIRVRADAVDDIIPGTANYGTFARASKPYNFNDNIMVELRDFYIDLSISDIDVRVGKQQIVWGQLDGFKLLDQVNPQSYQEFILEDFDQSRIGLWSTSVEFSIANTDIQLVYAPDTSVSELPNNDGLFAFQAPRFRFGLPVPEEGAAIAMDIDKPGDPFADGVFAARLSKYIAGWDLALVAIKGLDHTPVANLQISPTGASLTQVYKSRKLLGASASTTLGSFVFRGEMGYYPKRFFNAGSGILLRSEELDQFTLAAGLDYIGPSGVFLSLQLISDKIFDAPADIARPDNDFLVSIVAQQYFRNETVRAETRLYGANKISSDGLFRSRLTYIVNDETELSVNLDLFYGEKQGIYGQFSQRDNLSLEIKKYF